VAMWAPPTLEGYEVVNRGVGNQTTQQGLLRFDREIPALRPAVVLIELGVNDLRSIPMFPDRRDDIVRECKENLRQLVEKSRALGATVVLTTIFPLGDVSIFRRLVWTPEPVFWAIVEVNEYIRTLAAERVVVFAAEPIIASAGKIKGPFQTDYLHESPAAYQALNTALATLLRHVPTDGR
jgi:lysophospholipase L1-like esterase